MITNRLRVFEMNVFLGYGNLKCAFLVKTKNNKVLKALYTFYYRSKILIDNIEIRKLQNEYLRSFHYFIYLKTKF